jgi:hypothetical protein
MSIQKRTVFYDDTNGIKRFWDWALTTTTLGVMAEPFQANARMLVGADIAHFDPTDEISRIDDLQSASIDASLLILSGGDHQLHGGTQLSRDGR